MHLVDATTVVRGVDEQKLRAFRTVRDAIQQRLRIFLTIREQEASVSRSIALGISHLGCGAAKIATEPTAHHVRLGSAAEPGSCFSFSLSRLR